MPETITKAALLDNIQSGYNQFEALLAPLSEEQMTIPAVNGPWSVKDNIAHLTAWHDYLLNQLQGVIDGEKPPKFMPGLSEDEINEGFYQQNKDRPLAEVMADFRLSYQRILAAVQSISEEALNAPFPWRQNGNAAWGLIAGNTYEHYEEHGNIIRRWLGQA
ncbi:MAG TPA: ClbS/DfsB family four-helix bundle protein [Ktedonobacteraceae bacterium]